MASQHGRREWELRFVLDPLLFFTDRFYSVMNVPLGTYCKDREKAAFIMRVNAVHMFHLWRFYRVDVLQIGFIWVYVGHCQKATFLIISSAKRFLNVPPWSHICCVATILSNIRLENIWPKPVFASNLKFMFRTCLSFSTISFVKNVRIPYCIIWRPLVPQWRNVNHCICRWTWCSK